MPEYDANDTRFPCGLCMSCYHALSRVKNGKATTVSNFQKYQPAPINVDNGRGPCSCFICKTAKENGLKFVQKKENSGQFVKQTSAQNQNRCGECLTILHRGVKHECSNDKLVENILALGEKVLDMVASEHLRNKDEEEISLANKQGGKPLLVTVERKGNGLKEPVCKTTNMLTHDVIDAMEKELEISERKMLLLLTWIRKVFGRHSVAPYWREILYEENGIYQEFFNIEDVGYKNGKGDPIIEPTGFCNDCPTLLNKIAKERGYDDFSKLTLKICTDSGKDHLKVIASLYDSKKLHQEKLRKAIKRKRGEHVDCRSAVGPLQTIMLATVPKVPESHGNVKIIYEKLKIDELRAVFTGDFKILNICTGVGTCSSKYPCAYCEAVKLGREMVCDDNTRLRTTDNITENNERWIQSGKMDTDKTAKGFYSCVNAPIIQANDNNPEKLVLLAFPPPSLHIRIGIIVKTLFFIHCEWEKLDEGSNGVDAFLSDLNIVKKSYFGLTLEGNECRDVLNNLSELEKTIPDELKIFIDLLKSFKTVDDKVLGYTLDPDWEKFIKNFGDLYSQIMKRFPDTVTETVKAHALIKHVPQFLKADGSQRGMAEWSEQEGETAHSTFDKIWRRLFVADRTSKAFKINYLKAIAIFNRKHT